MRGRGAPAAVLSPAGACPSGDVCAQSHCSISALGCAPPSPPSLRARSLARCQPPRRSLERGFFFFPSAFTSLATVQGPVRAACSVMHNACLSLPAPSGAPNPIPMGLEQVWGRGVKSLLYGVGAAPATGLCWGHPPLCSVSIYKHSPVPEYMCVTVGVHNWVYVQAAEIAL